MKSNYLILVGILFIVFIIPISAKNIGQNYKPEQGYVPTAEVAIKIAVAVWEPIYGKTQIESEKPYVAKLNNGIWTVTGTLPANYEGGTATAEISKETGCIIKIIHGK
jgi:hypothetical protein